MKELRKKSQKEKATNRSQTEPQIRETRTDKEK